mmetsp:Transcript_98451/g.195259  ORF Transcript_98451/g.195259 Transcript_98451/m.195259 type:complete len:256 (+) Transcript_98451:1422-2189(+)
MSRSFFCRLLKRFSVSSSMSKPRSEGAGSSCSALAAACGSSRCGSSRCGSSVSTSSTPAGLGFSSSTGGSWPCWSSSMSRRILTSESNFCCASGSRVPPFSFSLAICPSFFFSFWICFSCSSDGPVLSASGAACGARGAETGTASWAFAGGADTSLGFDFAACLVGGGGSGAFGGGTSVVEPPPPPTCSSKAAASLCNSGSDSNFLRASSSNCPLFSFSFSICCNFFRTVRSLFSASAASILNKQRRESCYCSCC